ncbi:hypothetical protein HY214_03685 [Candidatus Roizmanbacteria bacterium]|nr:hypothetical protein [Candidatus Roizmanbacteria bacterium]
MKWVGICGSWRKTSRQVEHDVRLAVRNILAEGDAIVSGGALNVDYFATDEALKIDSQGKRIKIFLPTTLTLYSQHYRKRASEGIITEKQADMLIGQLTILQKLNPSALIENKKNTIADKTTYYERISQIVTASDEIYAFQVNNSPGVQDTIDKARQKGIALKLYSYKID